jgi:VWFA-related protein
MVSRSSLLRRVAVYCLIPALWVASLAAQDAPSGSVEAQPPDPPFRVDVNLVTVRFSVKDAAGRFVNNLTQDEISIFENGARQQMATFQPPSGRSPAAPVKLMFLLDVSGSTIGSRNEEILAAENFLRNVPASTEAGVYGFSDKLYKFQDFTTRPDQLRKGFEQAREGKGRTLLYRSAAEYLELLDRTPDGKRRVVVIISDGEDPEIARAEEVIRLALQKEVTIFTVWVPTMRTALVSGSGPGVQEEFERQHRAFASLASRTSGRSFQSFESILDFGGTLAEINAELFGSLYTAGYYTVDPHADRDSRRIEVISLRPGQEVLGIFANLPERLRSKKDLVAALFNNTRLPSFPEHLQRQFREIGAELDLLPLKPSAEIDGLPFRIQVSPFTLAGFDGRGLRTQLGILGILFNSRGEEVARIRDFLAVDLSKADLQRGKAIVYNSKLQAPPGRYGFWLAVLDLSTWRMTAFDNEVQVRGK